MHLFVANFIQQDTLHNMFQMFMKNYDKHLLAYVPIMKKMSPLVLLHTLAGVGWRRQNVAAVT